MNIGYVKGLEPRITKHLALLIAICYLLHPLHDQFKIIFHEVSHALEAPADLIEHDTHSDHKLVHAQHDHHLGEPDHQHKLIDLWDAFMEKSNNESPYEPLVDWNKIDKHLVNGSFRVALHSDVPTERTFRGHFGQLREGHYKKRPDPPKYLFNKC